MSTEKLTEDERIFDLKVGGNINKTKTPHFITTTLAAENGKKKTHSIHQSVETGKSLLKKERKKKKVKHTT